MKKMRDKLGTIANIAIIIAVVMYLFAPGGPLVQKAQAFKSHRQTMGALERHWPQLRAAQSTIGAGTREIVVFFDYECAVCKKNEAFIDEVVNSDGNARFVYRHFPLPSHPMAGPAASAAICAERQGRFREMHVELFKMQGKFDDVVWSDLARAAAVPDIPAFEACLTAPETRTRLAQDLELGGKLNVNATPTFAFQGGMHIGLANAAALRRALTDGK